MNTNAKKLAESGLKVPEIILPKDRKSMNRWAVVACDQYTSQKDYWKSVEEYTAGIPSTLNIIFPEAYLEDPDPEKRINEINSTMREYVKHGVFEEPAEGFILVHRETPVSESRWGLMAAIDLEEYDFSPESKALVRATEGTILERIPPRVKIRKDAELELPHIMVLIDDPDKTVIEALIKDIDSFTKVYDFDLMMKSGHLTGYRIDSDKYIEQIAEALLRLSSPETMREKYGTGDRFLYAMGDGNHSLATAKTIWEEYKKTHTGEKDLMENPARWALVEIVNIFSEGINFEAIHRVLFNSNDSDFFSLAEKSGFNVSNGMSKAEMIAAVESSRSVQVCGFCTADNYGLLTAESPDSSVAAGTFQNLIDTYIESSDGSYVDYIHGYDVTDEIGRKKGNIGFFLPAISKSTFFKTIVEDGAFPRKTFSMGESFEKRFYLEARRIKT